MLCLQMVNIKLTAHLKHGIYIYSSINESYEWLWQWMESLLAFFFETCIK